MTTTVETPTIEGLDLAPITENGRNYSGLLLTKHQLIEMWDAGILSAMAYAYLALLHDREFVEARGSIDLDFFADAWEGIPKPNAVSGKRLHPHQLRAALGALEKKEVITLGDRQLKLEFTA